MFIMNGKIHGLPAFLHQGTKKGPRDGDNIA